MKRFNPIYYLLFILLIMGAFASMAQNSYGLTVMGVVGFLFGLLFLAEFILVARNKEHRSLLFLAEAACLFVLAILFGLRLFYIYFRLAEEVFAVAGLGLALIYTSKMIRRYRELGSENHTLALISLFFHASIVIFLFSLVLAPFALGIAQWGGIISLLLLVIYLVAALGRKKYLVEGENQTAFSMIKLFRDHSVIIVSLFILFTLYTGLNRIGVLPGIYSDQFPQEYFRLVEKASSGQEKSLDGNYRHEEFKRQYELFLEHRKGDTK